MLRVLSRYSGGGTNPNGFDSWYSARIAEHINDGEGYVLDWDDGDSRHRSVCQKSPIKNPIIPKRDLLI